MQRTPALPGGNKIACENSKPGTDPDIWEIDGAGDPAIQGFSTDISVNVGQRIDFKIDTTASSYTIDIYRMGYYQGLGARKIASVTPSAQLPQTQPNCITDVQTDLYDCGNWGVSASWTVPAAAVSGVYIAHIKRSTGDGSHITFVVRDDSSTVRRRLPDFRHHLAGLQHLRRLRLLQRRRATAAPTSVSYNRPVMHARTASTVATSSCQPSTHWSASWSATATTSATSRASTPTVAAT